MSLHPERGKQVITEAEILIMEVGVTNNQEMDPYRISLVKCC